MNYSMLFYAGSGGHFLCSLLGHPKHNIMNTIHIGENEYKVDVRFLELKSIEITNDDIGIPILTHWPSQAKKFLDMSPNLPLVIVWPNRHLRELLFVLFYLKKKTSQGLSNEIGSNITYEQIRTTFLPSHKMSIHEEEWKNFGEYIDVNNQNRGRIKMYTYENIVLKAEVKNTLFEPFEKQIKQYNRDNMRLLKKYAHIKYYNQIAKYQR